MDCKHDLAEMETACADGLCPLCLRARIKALEEELLNALLEAEKNKLRRRAGRENG